MSDCNCEDECPPCPAGIPAWVMTFADLMSLLMCFFVLLLSFSEMDASKYKQLAGSMENAFGVQNQVKIKDIPKGTSIIAQEFSPGRPKPTPLNVVQQTTTKNTFNTLDVTCPEGDTSKVSDSGAKKADAEAKEINDQLARLAELGKIELETKKDAMEMASALSQEVKKGQVEIETKGTRIIIRVKEKGSFLSGSATLRPSFIPIMAKIRDLLKAVNGVYLIEGHTDDVPINTPRFRSNWELSTARAVSVAHEVFWDGSIDQRRFTIAGHADTRPLAENNNEKNRALNRRVEIIIEKGKKSLVEDFKLYGGEKAKKAIEEARKRDAKTFDFSEDEIF